MEQISEVTECELKRIGTLKFRHHAGACSNLDDRAIYLCFDVLYTRLCRSAVDPLGDFVEISRSTYDHALTRTAASQSMGLVFCTV